MRPVRAHFLQIDIRCARPGKGSRVPWRARSLIHANLIETLPNLKCIVAVGCCRLSAATRQSTVSFDAIVTVGSHVAYIVVCRDLCLIVKILLSDNTQQYHNGVTGAIRRRFLSHARSAEKWLKAARLPRARLRRGRRKRHVKERGVKSLACESNPNGPSPRECRPHFTTPSPQIETSPPEHTAGPSL